MEIVVKEYEEQYVPAMMEVWNDIIREKNAFPEILELNLETAKKYFAKQSYTGIALDGDEVVGVYILHPNNIGRCGHISNASYAVKSGCRGKSIGEKLVRDCMHQAACLGFKILQFNAVVCTNEAAIRLYKKIGFTKLGVIPNGFLLGDGSYTDIYPHYIEL